MKTVLRRGCHNSVGHRCQRRERGMVLRRLHSCQSTTMSSGAARSPHRSRGWRRRCRPSRRADPAIGLARTPAASRWRFRRRQRRESHAPHRALNSRHRAGRARRTRPRAPLCHRSTWAAASRSARAKARRSARPSRRRRSAASVGIAPAANAKMLSEKEKTGPRQRGPEVATTTESTYDVKEKRRNSLTSMTTDRRFNKTAERPSVADVTRLPLRSHKGGCYSPSNPKGGLALAKLPGCVY